MKVQCRLFFYGVYREGLQFTVEGEYFYDRRTEGHKSRLASSQNFVFMFFCRKMFKVFAVYCLWEDMRDFANL